MNSQGGIRISLALGALCTQYPALSTQGEFSTKDEGEDPGKSLEDYTVISKTNKNCTENFSTTVRRVLQHLHQIMGPFLPPFPSPTRPRLRPSGSPSPWTSQSGQPSPVVAKMISASSPQRPCHPTGAFWELRKSWALGAGVRPAGVAKMAVGGFDWVGSGYTRGYSDAAEVA